MGAAIRLDWDERDYDLSRLGHCRLSKTSRTICGRRHCDISRLMGRLCKSNRRARSRFCRCAFSLSQKNLFAALIRKRMGFTKGSAHEFIEGVRVLTSENKPGYLVRLFLLLVIFLPTFGHAEDLYHIR